MFDVGPSQICKPGVFIGVVWLGRGRPGSYTVKVVGFVDGDNDGNEWDDICVSCRSALQFGSVVEFLVRDWPRLGPDRTAGV